MRRYRESIEYAEREERGERELGDLRLRILAFIEREMRGIAKILGGKVVEKDGEKVIVIEREGKRIWLWVLDFEIEE